MRNRCFKILFAIFMMSVAAVAQEDAARWSVVLSPTEAGIEEGASIKASLRAVIGPGWHLYALDQPPGGPIPTTIKVAPNSPFILNGQVKAPTPQIKPDPNFVIDDKPLTTKFYENNAEFGLDLKALSRSRADELALDVRFQLCNDTLCLPPKTVRVSLSGTLDVKRSALSGTTVETLDKVSESRPVIDTVAQQTLPSDLWAFIWLAATLGALSLLTPCVFPMIPITVSYFTNHSSGSKTKAVRLAVVYSIGIIATFTLLGMLLAIFVGAAGINLFAANPWINLLITAIFLFFAFNLFGAYEITLPSGLLTKLDRLTRTHEGEGSGVIGALLMGLTFTLTSFTCTSPFVGTILVSASQGSWQMPLIGMLAFSTVFALPFFVLALVPQWVAGLPRAGGWMNSVKVSMGFLEVAAAMKFLSNVDLVWKWGIFTRGAVIATWIAIGIILTIYLLGKFQLSHDSKPDKIGAFRLASAIFTLAVSFYLLTGLFGAKLGELEAFLPPDLGSSTSRMFGGEEKLKWIRNDYNAALAKAKQENKHVFIDFTGYTCTNCRWMEANIFVKPDVSAELEKYVLVSLYTDGEGDIYEKQQAMEQQMFGTVALPFYAVVDSEGRSVSTFPGLTRDPNEFIKFLSQAQKNR